MTPLQAYWTARYIRRAGFHATLLTPENRRAEETLLNAQLVAFGGTSMTAPVDGVTATPGYTVTRTFEVLYAKLANVPTALNSDVASLLAAELTKLGWT